MQVWKRFVYGIVAVSSFIFALQLLVESVGALESVIRRVIAVFVTSDVSALGSGWLSAMLVMNGASIAAVGLSFLTVGIFSVAETFMVVAGSRLGAAFIVVALGVLEFVRGHNESIRDATSIGVLSFLATYMVYVPVAVMGYLLLDVVALGTGSPLFMVPQPSFVAVFNQGAVWLLSLVGSPVAGFVLGLLALFGSLKVFDWAFAGLSAETFRTKYFRFMLHNPWVGFAAGLVVTAVTTSVSISIGLLVPLYSKGYLKRGEIVPYIMGANVSTMSSVIIAALVLDSVVGMSVALYVTGLVAGVTLLCMVFYDRFFAGLKAVFDRIMESKVVFYGFMASLPAVPLVLLLL